MIVVYEQSFDGNEWFVISGLLILHLLLYLTPRIFSTLEGIAFYLFGITVVYFFDHTLSVKPWDFYDVNDSSSYQLMDVMYYVMNGPVGYFFVYLYCRLNISGYQTIFYLLLWSSFSVLTEWAGMKVGLFHYDKGYKMYWSFPIYMIVQMTLIIFYSKSRGSAQKEDRKEAQ
ncbi:hypothetical protein ACOJQI_12390 [Bacillus salacetis]|uniref:hypothetical protein n=1 Tax=Bacillus salacetis TaxID=2315464 RepID=UPI003BA2BACE